MDKVYHKILEGKKIKPLLSGWRVSASGLHPDMFEFQKYIVRRAIEAGRFAIFADCGLGKTFMQLEWANNVVKKTKKPVLILAPLAVGGQTIAEGKRFGIEVIKYVPEMQQMHNTPKGVYISNYEQLDNINTDDFAGVALDESSILKNFTGATKRLLIEAFAETPYKLCCTATPSPNDLNEIGNHSEFLNVLDAQDMRAKWFVREEGMNNYRLKSHAKKDFFAWISSWAVMLTNPADIGYPMQGYDLPALNFIERQISTAKRDNGKLFNDASINATNFNSELRITKLERLSEVAKIVNESTENFIVWIKHNEEGEDLRKLIPGSVEVKGSDSPEYKEEKLLGFANNEFRVLITKTKIAQFGLNYQNCHNQVFASLDFSFESLYQAIRRSYRFGQKHQVNIYLITTDTMENVIQSIHKKEKQFTEMQREMNKNINSKTYGLVDKYEYKEFNQGNVWLMKGDSCIEIDRIKDGSLDLIVFSPPFSALFTYSNYIHDMGNNASHADFFKQYGFLLKKMYKKLRDGGIMACHTKDLGVYKNSSGYTGQYNFTDEHTLFVEKHKFKLHSKVTIWCDPVLEMQRTKTQRLLYKTLTTDSGYTGIGMAEYFRIFKKWEGNEEDWKPITHINKENFPLDVWQKWASPVWFDIKRTDVLNGKEGTDMGDEKHIAPLQLEAIHRIINLWSNPGDTVFTPFLGIGSECYMAIRNNRKCIGIELKDSYYDVAVKNCRAAVNKKSQLPIWEEAVA
ncbi:MAG TPA: DNA methyltransferase [Chitinophagaceae bacterium]